SVHRLRVLVSDILYPEDGPKFYSRLDLGQGYKLIFVDPGVKIDGTYYRDVLLKQKMLPSIRQLAGDLFVFQQDSAPAHRARATVEYLRQATPEFISPDLWPPYSPDLNPVDYKIWGRLQDRVYQKRVRDVDELKQRLVEVLSEL